MNSVIDLSFLQLAIAYVFILLVLLIMRLRGIKREKQVIIACIRMTLQLIIMGYVLTYIFTNPSWYLTCGMVSIMLGFAIYTIFRRVNYKLSNKMKLLVASAMIFGSLTTILIFTLLIIRITPWYNPQYFIPIFGMIVGNSMTGILLGLNKLCGDFRDKRPTIENSLLLGATPKKASREIVNSAFDTALLPTINSMLGMGIVALPGMMTGQILSGILPLVAIEYQIGIMLSIMGSVSLTVIIFVVMGYRLFFNNQEQLLEESE